MTTNHSAVLHLPRAVVLRQRIWIGLLVLLAISVPVCYLHNSSASESELSPLSQKVAAMCKAIYGSCDAVSKPHHLNETITLPHVKNATRRIASVSCQAGGRRLILLFNETTGRICCVFGDNNVDANHRATITTPEEAIDAAMLRLRQLEMLPDGVQIALAADPKLIRKKTAWQILWKVKRPGGEPPAPLKMTLDSAGGAPLNVTDMYQMKQFAPQ